MQRNPAAICLKISNRFLLVIWLSATEEVMILATGSQGEPGAALTPAGRKSSPHT